LHQFLFRFFSFSNIWTSLLVSCIVISIHYLSTSFGEPNTKMFELEFLLLLSGTQITYRFECEHELYYHMIYGHISWIFFKIISIILFIFLFIINRYFFIFSNVSSFNNVDAFFVFHLLFFKDKDIYIYISLLSSSLSRFVFYILMLLFLFYFL